MGSNIDNLCDNIFYQGTTLCVFSNIQRFPRPVEINNNKTIFMNENLTSNKKIEETQEKQNICNCLNCNYSQKIKPLPLPIIERNEKRNKSILEKYNTFCLNLNNSGI